MYLELDAVDKTFLLRVINFTKHFILYYVNIVNSANNIFTEMIK